jgi:hypothetical protein
MEITAAFAVGREENPAINAEITEADQKMLEALRAEEGML